MLSERKQNLACHAFEWLFIGIDVLTMAFLSRDVLTRFASRWQERGQDSKLQSFCNSPTACYLCQSPDCLLLHQRGEKEWDWNYQKALSEGLQALLYQALLSLLLSLPAEAEPWHCGFKLVQFLPPPLPITPYMGHVEGQYPQNTNGKKIALKYTSGLWKSMYCTSQIEDEDKEQVLNCKPL